MAAFSDTIRGCVTTNKAGVDIGVRLRALRQASGRTLSDVAAAAGISKGHLSQLERGRVSTSIEVLQTLADALGCALAELVGAAPPSPVPAPQVVRRGRRPRARVAPGCEVALLSPLPARAFQVVELSIAPGFAGGGDEHHHDGEEWVLVIEGEVEIAQGGRVIRLRAGDAARYEAAAAHTIRNPGPDRARLLCVMAPPAELPIQPEASRT